VVPLIVLAALAFAAGMYEGGAADRAQRQLVTRYVTAWEHGDYAEMYTLLDPATRASMSLAQVQDAYQRAATTATLVSVTAGHVGNSSGGTIPVQMRVRTRRFGTLVQTLEVPLDGTGADARVAFGPTLVFPGLRAGERLKRRMHMPPRATLLADDGTPLAQGRHRSSPIPDVAGEIVGRLGPIPAAQAHAYAADGYPRHARIGKDGLERIFQPQLAGTPGGTLLAGHRVLATAAAVPGTTVKTTIDPALERAAIAAMGGQYSGIAAMDPRTGAVLALAGVAFSAAQPPGPTMKIITATGALEAGLGGPSTTFPLRLADVAATIAMGGRRPIPTLQFGQPPHFVPVTSRHVARRTEQMMLAVVQYGTGTAAQIAGVQVAGQTGTAELTDTSAPGASTAQNADAWFVGYAPAGSPAIAVGALYPNQSAAAAPAARQVLEAALHR
jgi:peptidoglycan glycosyltransferase